jgi:cyclic 2,3-diphosphoglycerate synthetase
MNVLVLVDGEHYPPVTRWGIEAARSMGHQVVGALFLGGFEKIGPEGPPDLGVLTVTVDGDLRNALAQALDRIRPEAVLDLSDEPVLGYRERMELVAVALARGVPYVGADFRIDPPISGPSLPVPTVAVIGTGKRAGKTAISAEVARIAAELGLHPTIVAMGRGGPPAPQMAEPGAVSVGSLLEMAGRGHHAASDYLEDALTSGALSIGARRCGGGLAGAPFVSNVREAAEVGMERGAGTLILEGSGAAVPPIPWDTGILVVPATIPPEFLEGYLGPFRILLSDLVVVTMAAGLESGPENLFALTSTVKRLHEDAHIAVTDFQPAPLGDVRGKAVYFATTAPRDVAERQATHLREAHGCRVVGVTDRLADRAALARDLAAVEGYDVLLTELKAAAVDVAARAATERGVEVVFVDNRPVDVGDGPKTRALIERTLRLAHARYEDRA